MFEASKRAEYNRLRFITWNCCWKLKEKLPALFAELPDVAIIQECSKDALENLRPGYFGQWLAGPENHGLGMIYREPFAIENIETASSASYFAKIDISGPVSFRLVAAWTCPPGGSGYIGHLHHFLDTQLEWFKQSPVVFAGDLNSQHGASFDTGQQKHADLDKRLKDVGLVDAYASLRGIDDPRLREATHRHQWSNEKPFHIDYVYVPDSWLPRISSIAVGAPSLWSKLSDHSPVMMTVK